MKHSRKKETHRRKERNVRIKEVPSPLYANREKINTSETKEKRRR